MKNIFRKSAIFALLIALLVSSLSACGANNEGQGSENNSSQVENSLSDSQTPSESQTPSGSERPNESEKTTESEQPGDSQKPTQTPKPSESETPSDSQTPSESEEPSESEKPSESPKPSESEEPSESESQTPTPKPSESEEPSESPKPSESQKPTPTPEPSESEEPSEPDVPSEKPDSGNDNLTTAEKLAKDIVDDIIKSSMSDFEKAITIHDWLTFNIDYDYTYSNYYVEETLRDRKGVCQGYALSFEMMAEMAGLEVNYVTGTATNSAGKTESHAWNQVKISGVWYNVDVTWDDPSNGASKDPDDHSGNRYDYFLISKSEIEKDHKPQDYKNSEKSCPKNYDRVKILKYAVNSGVHGDIGFAETQAEANSAIEKYVKANKSEFWLWVYDTSLTQSNMWEKVRALIANGTYPASCTEGYPPEDGIAKFRIKITPLSEWNKIPVVTNGEDFVKELDKQADAGKTTFDIRYETTDGNIVVYGSSKYAFQYYSSVYNDGKSKLLTIEIIE